MASNKSSKDGGSDAAKKAPDGGTVTRSNAAERREHSSLEKASPSSSHKAKGKSHFSKGDRMVVYSSLGMRRLGRHNLRHNRYVKA